jgi:2,5-dihydroxypyridine 5,6-dioxygenase
MNKTLTELFVLQYQLCKVREGEIVGIISEFGKKEAYVAAAVAAARQVGASPLVLTASSLSNPTLPPYKASNPEVPALLAGAGECDLIIDVTVGGLIHSDVRTRITGAGKRMLFVAEPADVLQRLMGNTQVRSRVEAAADALRVGERMRVTSAAGTDFEVDISGPELPITRQWGYVDEPGRWDHWPSGFVACFPNDKTAQGRIVLNTGDVLLPWCRYVQEPVSLTIRDGYITAIEGEGVDAFVLRDYFARWNDPEVYALSHMGWGVHPAASWSALAAYDPHTLYGQELRSTEGNFMWSTGSNRFAKRETPAHLDVPMAGCTVRIDGRVLVDGGKLVQRAEA